MGWDEVIIAFLGGLALGQMIGVALERWNWRMSGFSHHHRHKSGGTWFDVKPEGEEAL